MVRWMQDTVVGGEDEEGVAPHAFCLQRTNHTPQLVIERCDHSGHRPSVGVVDELHKKFSNS